MQILNKIKKKYQNWKIQRWESRNKQALKHLSVFDTRIDEFPEDLQKMRKFGFLLRNKKWLTSGQFQKWYTALTVTRGILDEEEQEQKSDLVIY